MKRHEHVHPLLNEEAQEAYEHLKEDVVMGRVGTRVAAVSATFWTGMAVLIGPEVLERNVVPASTIGALAIGSTIFAMRTMQFTRMARNSIKDYIVEASAYYNDMPELTPEWLKPDLDIAAKNTG